MQKQNSKLFAKFEDAKIVNETAVKINGRGGSVSISGPTESSATGDTESTSNGNDCGDNSSSTDVFKDSVITQLGQDN